LYYYLYFERNRSISIISVLQFFLFILGISILGFYILNQIGGITEFSNLLKKLSLIDNLRWDSSKQETASPLFVVPELFRMGSSLHNSYPQGGIWTVSMIFSSSIVFLGIQTSPSFTMFAINKGNPNLFARYQLYVSGIILGFIILVLPVIIGFGSHFLGANHIINSQKLNISNLLPESLSLVGEGNLILEIVKSISLDFSLGLGFFLLCLIASIHSTSALFINFSIKSFLNGFNSTNSNEKKRSLTYKFILTLIFIFTLILIIFFENFLLSIGSIAMSLSLQLLVALLSICYFPFMNKKGVIIGAIVGMIVVVLTEQITVMLLGEYLPWGKWPLYISSGLWGLMFNIIFSIFFSLIFQNKIDKEFRINFHKKINEFDGNTEKNNLINLIIALCLIFVWMFFSLGPLNLFGNAIFGNPKVIESWIFGFPSIWLWQFLSWFFGVIIIWIIAYKLKFSVIKNNYDSFGR
jgi:Na+/proline symporter